MEQNIKKIGLVNVVVSLLLSGAAAFLAFYANTLSGKAAIAFFGLTFLVCAVSYFQMRLEESERLEKLEFEELNKGKGASSLFNITDSDIFPAQRSREQFERFFVPFFTGLIFLAQAGISYWLWDWLRNVVALPANKPVVAMSLYALFALILFLLGKYSASFARVGGERLLRPGASYLLLSAYVCFAVTLSLAAVQLGFPNVDRYAAWVLGGLLALTGIETIIGLVLEIYRPRVKGKVGRVLYESRLVGLLAQPEGLVTTAAQALDYQFGFKVSETWFYRFLERALGWIILLQVLVLWFSTVFVFIGPGEQGLIERFGRPISREILEPGLHVKMPWPIDRVFRERTREIQSFNVGFVPDGDKEEKTVLWTVPHYKEEFNLLVASRDRSVLAGSTNATAEGGAPVDLLTVSIPVQFQIKDLRAWAYKHTNASNLLEKVATREVVKYLVGVDVFDLMSKGRGKAAEELKALIQAKADELELGVEIVLVGLQDVHPPVKVARKFEEVTGARQEAEATLRQAEGYAARTLAMAGAEAIKRIRESESYSNRVVVASHARAAQFTNQSIAYAASPGIFAQRSYLQALERGSTNARKYIVAVTNSQQILHFNLEDKIRPDLLDAPLPESRR